MEEAQGPSHRHSSSEFLPGTPYGCTHLSADWNPLGGWHHTEGTWYYKRRHEHLESEYVLDGKINSRYLLIITRVKASYLHNISNMPQIHNTPSLSNSCCIIIFRSNTTSWLLFSMIKCNRYPTLENTDNVTVLEKWAIGILSLLDLAQH